MSKNPGKTEIPFSEPSTKTVKNMMTGGGGSRQCPLSTFRALGFMIPEESYGPLPGEVWTNQTQKEACLLPLCL